ncbi:hypothetical protein [Ensifer sp. LBL]|uniref:hypothetical protein n=1 Tax=Ensifer sp. LBL TaxID=2991056 RepID=UPI003D23F23F
MKKFSSAVTVFLVGSLVFAPLVLNTMELRITPLREQDIVASCALLEEANFGYVGKVRACVNWSFQFPNSNPYMISIRTIQAK